jgi:peptidoglycan/xylan/chitin deacetylase (PgdA/CDA1 family)
MPEDARAEIEASFGFLRELTGEKPASFAYPNGQPGRDYTDIHVGMVRRAGFSLAVSTAPGPASPSDDRYELPRVALWSASSWKLTANIARIYLRQRRPEN